MSVLTDIIIRDRLSEARKEDSFEAYDIGLDSNESTIKRDLYRDYVYEIHCSSVGGIHPYIFFYNPVNTISAFSGMTYAELNDRNGETKKVRRSVLTYVFEYRYNKGGDYVGGKNESGKRYTVKEIEADCKAFIDDVIKKEDEYIRVAAWRHNKDSIYNI